MSEKRHRSRYWDNIKGILIILMVFAHILYQLQDSSGVINSIVDYIYMFHMPAFVFVSGYFGKSERSRSAESIVKLVFLYFIFDSIMGFMFGFGSLLEPMYSYWYLIALIFWRLTAHHISKFKDINLILIVIAVFAGYFYSINNTFAVSRIISFYPFYMLGYQLPCEKHEKYLQTAYSKRLVKGILALTAAGIIAFFAYGYFNYSDNDLLMYPYFDKMAAVGRIVLYLIAFLMICFLRSVCLEKKIFLISMLGRNSLWIFILHRPFTFWISDFIAGMNVGAIISISVLSTLVLCLLFGNSFIVKYLDRFVDLGVQIFTDNSSKKFDIAKLAVLLVSLAYIFYAVQSFTGVTLNDVKRWLNKENIEDPDEPDEENDEDIIYPIMSYKQKSDFDNAFRITFSGDLILLEDQVKRACTEDGYDFSPVFEYSKKYIGSIT